MNSAQFPSLSPYKHEGRLQADCPACGMAGAVHRRNGLLCFDCDGMCGAGSGIYTEASNGRRDGSFTTRVADLTKVRPVRFTWRPFLVKGKLNLMTGEEDMGKSTLQAWIAARATTGELRGDYHGRPGNVLFVGADEDDWNEIVVPRLYAADADLDRVFEFTGGIFNVVDHIDSLEAALTERAYALVVFEQLMDVLPTMRNANDPVALRAALRPLRHVLRTREVTGLGTLHVNKADAASLRQKMQGSMQFGALSRSTILVDRHPEDDDRRVAVLGKSNYVPTPRAAR